MATNVAINRIAIITTINRIAIIINDNNDNRIAIITTINRIAIITTISVATNVAARLQGSAEG